MKKYFGLIIAVIGLIFASCNFNSNSEVSYKVLHMQQNIENDGYTVAEEESFKGRIGSKIKIQTKDYEGFYSKPVEVQTVKEDLSVPVYYDRNLITFDFNLAGGKGETTITKKYGTPVTKEIIPDPVKGTSKFSFWSPALPETFIEDTTFTANWDYSSYKVKFMFQNAEDDEYSPDTGAASPEETYFGNSGEETTYNPPIIQGFELKKVEQVILGEEEQTVTVYYDRVTVTVLIDLDGGDGISLVKGRMGSSFTDSLLGTYTKKGYVFEGFDKELPETFRLEDNNRTILKALWRGDGQARYSVRFYYENLDRTFTEDKDYTVNLVGQVGDNTGISFNDGKVYLAGTERSLKEGFHPVTEEDKDYISYTLKNEIIKGDETTLAKVYCARNVSTMTFDLKGGNVDGNEEPVVISGRWGEKIDFPAVTPKKLGYTFTQFKQETTKYTAWPSESMELTGIAEYTVNTFKVRVYGNYGDEDLPGKVEYFETSSSYTNDVDNTIYFYFTGADIVKPLHTCKGISKTEDGEIENFYIDEEYGKKRINIPVEKETVENDGKIITFYCQWEPYKIGKVEKIDQKIPNTGNSFREQVQYEEDGTLRFSVNYKWSTTSESYTADEWGKPEYVFSIGDSVIGGEERKPSSTSEYIYNLKDQGFSFEASTPVPLKVQLRYNISANPDKPKYLTGEETECYFYTPLEPATNLRVVDQENTLKCSWTNPKSKTGIKSVKLGAMIFKSSGNYERDYYGNYKALRDWSISATSASNGECDSEGEVTGEPTSLSSWKGNVFVCYVEVTDKAGFVSCTELIRAFPSYMSNGVPERAGGQFFYEDGTFSNEFIEDKIPVGISLGRNWNDNDGVRIMGLKALDEAAFYKSDVSEDIYAYRGYNFEKAITDAGLQVDDFEALKYCLNYNEGGFDDWYLPGSGELKRAYSAGVEDSLRILKEKGIECPYYESGKYYWSCCVKLESGINKYSAFSKSVYNDQNLSWSDLEALGPVGVIPIRIIMDSQ